MGSGGKKSKPQSRPDSDTNTPVNNINDPPTGCSTPVSVPRQFKTSSALKE